MKVDRNILEKLIETNAEAYSLLHYQYNALDTRYNQLEQEYREIVRRVTEAELINPDVFNDVKSAYSQSAILLSEAQEELNRLSSIESENTTLRTQVYDLEHSYKVASEERDIEFANNRTMHKLLKETQEKQQAAEYEARMYQAKYEDIQSRIKPASSLYQFPTGLNFDMDAINADNTPTF